MGTEIADFIAMESTNDKIIYIHCKYDDSNLSASTFQDVCGQAMKNIRYIINTAKIDNPYLDDRKIKWSKMWPYYGKDVKKIEKGMVNRCVKGGNADEIYNQYFKMLMNPETTYEVWIVHNGLSYDKLCDELISKNKQVEQLPQLIWLLQSTQDYLSEAGATLKIFCGKKEKKKEKE